MSEEGYAPLPEDFMDVEEDHIVPNGMYDLRVSRAKMKKSDNGNWMFLINHEICDDPNAEDVFHCLNIPNAESHKLIKQDFKRYLILFNIVPSPEGLHENDLLGAEANANISLGKHYKDPDRNCNSIILPKLD